MLQLRKPIPALTGKELNIGLGYLLFQMLLLPALLQGFNGLLPYPISAGLVNFLYFFINALAVVIIFTRLLKKTLLRASRNPMETIGLAVGGLALYWLCLSLLSFVVSLLLPEFQNLNDSNIAGLVAENYWLTALGAVILVPIAEETLHRGLIFGGLYPKNPVAAYLISCTIFAAIHVLSYVGLYEPVHLALAFLQYLPAGLVLAYAYRRSGTLLTPMLIHAAVNAMGILSMR